ncbi:MAG: winged helix-turn-helix transcriptional regulator [Spirochaetales bacterium]|nr:winged helix-turn-helix transcriptional regulator [Spirochaetales bacterium]
MANVFRALSDPTRREILKLLQKGNLNAGRITENFDMKAPSITHHLHILRNAGLVQSEKKGQQMIYSLNTTVLQDVLNWILELQGKSK